MSILVIREEIICLVILLFHFVYSRMYCRGSNDHRFNRLCLYAIFHVVFDMVTVFTVNHLDIVPNIVNYLCHITFYLTALLFGYEFFHYITYLAFPSEAARKCARIGAIPPIVYVLLIPFLNIVYLPGNGTNYSLGSCAYVGFALAVLYFIASAVVIAFRFQKLDRMIKYTVIPAVAFVLACLVIQILIPEFLFTGACLTIITIEVFFTLENPAGKYQERAYLDLGTGLKNKNCFQEDIETLSKKYFSEEKGKKKISYVVCDLNDLKKVNDTFGHIVGDDLIRNAAKALMKELKSAYGIYRAGGDEFVAIYIATDASVIESEISNVRAACENYSEGKEYSLSMAMGFAESGDDTKTMMDIAKKADTKMYENKKEMKKADSYNS